jgi:hypothetical protein
MSNNIQTAYEQVRKFNQIAGNLNSSNHEATLNTIEKQISFIQEEVEEAYDAFTAEDIQEVVDGACDAFVTVAGLMQELEAAGVNIEKALARVCANNLTKFPTTFEHNNNPEAYMPQGDVTAHHTDYGHVVYKRNIDGKVMKPVNYVPVDLSGTFPVDFFGSVAVCDTEN